jgi:hypothetical protein
MPVMFLGGGNYSPYFYDMVFAEGLDASLITVMDAADLRSTDGTSQVWTDVAGTDNWQRGSLSSSDASDPTFNGTAGVADENTYWSFDGGDFFSDSTLSWQDPWIKDNGTGSIVFLVRTVVSAGAQTFCCFDGGTNLLSFYMNSSEFLVATHVTNNANSTQVITGSNAVSGSAWHLIGYCFDEATTSIDLHIDTTLESLTWNASTRTTNLSVVDSFIGTDTVSSLQSGSRIGAVGFWNRKLSNAEWTSLYNRVKSLRSPSLP